MGPLPPQAFSSESYVEGPSVPITLSVSPTGTNAQVVYSLTDSAEGHFSIEATTGVIRLEKPLRVRPKAALELTVRASDLGTPIPLSTLGTVTISVVGLDDYLPVFLSTEHSVQVPEDAQRGTEVLQLATLTRPGAEKTSYRVVSGNEQGRFRLDARTGETASPLHTHTHTQFWGTLDSQRTTAPPQHLLAFSSLCISPGAQSLSAAWGQLIRVHTLFHYVPSKDCDEDSLLPLCRFTSGFRPSPGTEAEAPSILGCCGPKDLLKSGA